MLAFRWKTSAYILVVSKSFLSSLPKVNEEYCYQFYIWKKEEEEGDARMKNESKSKPFLSLSLLALLSPVRIHGDIDQQQEIIELRGRLARMSIFSQGSKTLSHSLFTSVSNDGRRLISWKCTKFSLVLKLMIRFHGQFIFSSSQKESSNEDAEDMCRNICILAHR